MRVNIGMPVVRTDGQRAGGRAVYGHVITKFSGMGRFTYPWCSAGALRAPELRYNRKSSIKPFLHKEPEYKVEKLKYKKRGGHAIKDQKINPNFQLVNKPSRINPHEVL